MLYLDKIKLKSNDTFTSFIDTNETSEVGIDLTFRSHSSEVVVSYDHSYERRDIKQFLNDEVGDFKGLYGDYLVIGTSMDFKVNDNIEYLGTKDMLIARIPITFNNPYRFRVVRHQVSYYCSLREVLLNYPDYYGYKDDIFYMKDSINLDKAHVYKVNDSSVERFLTRLRVLN
jgi:hypothetical protein